MVRVVSTKTTKKTAETDDRRMECIMMLYKISVLFCLFGILCCFGICFDCFRNEFNEFDREYCVYKDADKDELVKGKWQFT